MPKYQFIGRVLPLHLGISIAPKDIHWDDDPQHSSLSIDFKIRIASSIVHIDVDCNIIPSDISELYTRSLDLARASVNLLAFSEGLGPTIIIDTLIDPNGIPSWLEPASRNLKSEVTVLKFPLQSESDFDRLYKIVVEDVALFRALNDLIECIWNPHVAPVNCGRVIDSICRMITPSSKHPNEAAWKTMRDSLNLSETFVRQVSGTAIGPRHADPTYVPGTITSDVTRRAWAIMNRYLEYRRSGNQPLNSQTFPTL
jgi:hypothetical protein